MAKLAEAAEGGHHLPGLQVPRHPSHPPPPAVGLGLHSPPRALSPAQHLSAQMHRGLLPRAAAAPGQEHLVQAAFIGGRAYLRKQKADAGRTVMLSDVGCANVDATSYSAPLPALSSIAVPSPLGAAPFGTPSTSSSTRNSGALARARAANAPSLTISQGDLNAANGGGGYPPASTC